MHSPYNFGMKRFFKYLAISCGVLLALLALGIAYLLFIFDWSKSGEYASARLSEALGRDSAIEGKITIDPDWPVATIHTDKFRIANIEGAKDPQMLTTDKAAIAIDLSRLLRGTMEFPSIEVDSPKLVLEKDAKGNANWNFGDSATGGTVASTVPEERDEMPLIGRLIIHNGEVTYRDAVEKIDTTLTVNTLSGSADEGEQLQVRGKGKFNGEPFKLDLVGGSVLTLRENEIPYPINTKFDVGNTHVTVIGTAEDPFALEGLDIAMTVRGMDMADLFPVLGIALPNTPPYKLKGQLGYDKSEKVWTFNNFKGKMGDSDLRGDLKWEIKEPRPKLTATFISNTLDMDDLAGFIGATPDVGKGETASSEQKAQARQESINPLIIPDATLDIERISAMDAEVEFNGKKLLSEGLPMDDFHLKAVLNNRVLKLVPVQFGTASGDIIANITINAQAQPVKTDSDVQFKKLSLARMFADAAKSLGIPNETAGYIGGRAKLTGTGDSMRKMLSNAKGTMGIAMEGGQMNILIVEVMGIDIAESLGFMLSGDKPVPVRCIVGDFAVKDGVMRTDTFVIDTSDTNIQGEGSVNLVDERMEMTLTPQPKDPSILSARTPIKIGGTLKEPDISVAAGGLIARGGAAVALALATPIASLLAFIEPGLGENSDCAALLTENAAVQKGKMPEPKKEDGEKTGNANAEPKPDAAEQPVSKPDMADNKGNAIPETLPPADLQTPVPGEKPNGGQVID